MLTGRSITGAYAIPHPFYEAYLAFANTVMIGPARGAGRMEAILLIERMVDMFAREIGMDSGRGPAQEYGAAGSVPVRERPRVDI